MDAARRTGTAVLTFSTPADGMIGAAEINKKAWRAAVSCAPTRSEELVGSFRAGPHRGGAGHRGRGERPEAESDHEGAGDLGSCIALEGLGCRRRLEEQGFFVDFTGHLGSARLRRFDLCSLVRAVRDL